MTIQQRTDRHRGACDQLKARIIVDQERRRSSAAGTINRTPPRTAVRQALREEFAR